MTIPEIVREPLITFVTTDFAGITRGRSIAASGYVAGQRQSVGWVPANMSLTPFNLIADPNPWGSIGDLRLLADDEARFRFRIEGSKTDLDIVMCDIVELDGAPWVCCPRGFLKRALADLWQEAGVRLVAAFEQEFQVLGAPWPEAPAFSLQAMRRADPFGPCLMAALRDAGAHPEVVIAEYGSNQYEVTVAPAEGLSAADRAIVVRETVRELSRNFGWRSSFSPKTSIEGVGNGVHMHFSLRDGKGNSVTHDPTAPGGVSRLAGSFVAGILKHLRSLVAFTAPSPISYLRLQPHHWSASYTWFGDRDREASIRVCPVERISGTDPAASFNIEFRAADATSCPHLVLGVIVRAGLEGIRENLDTPQLFSGDPALLSDVEREALGLHPLPRTLGQALDSVQANSSIVSWFDPIAIETYIGMKRMELKLAGEDLDQALCERYASIY